MNRFRSIMKTVTAFALVIALAAGMAVSMGGKAKAAGTYTITYDLNGGIVAPNNSATTVTQVIGAGQKTSVKGDIFYYPGKVLLGWSLSKNGDVKYKPGQGNIMFYGNTKLYAVWGIRLHFDCFEKDKSTKLKSFDIDTSNGQTTFKKIKEKLPGVPAGCYSQKWFEYYSGKEMKDSDVVGSHGRYYRIVYVKFDFGGIFSSVVERNVGKAIAPNGAAGWNTDFRGWGIRQGNIWIIAEPGSTISSDKNIYFTPMFD